MNKKEEQEDKFFDLFAFLVTSARGSLEEGVFSASLRLIDAASRVSSLVPFDSTVERNKIGDSFLREMRSAIKNGMTTDYLASQEKYTAFLDSIVEKLAIEVRRRNNL